jgi:integrase
VKSPLRAERAPFSIRSFNRRPATFLVYADDNSGPWRCLTDTAKAVINPHYQIHEKTMDGSDAPNIGGLVPAIGPDLDEFDARAAAFARSSRAPATERAYSPDWRDFEASCDRAGVDPLPAAPATIGRYLADNAERLKVSTLVRRAAAIAVAHRLTGYPLDRGHPAIASVLAGIRLSYGSAQQAKAAILTADLRRIVRALPARIDGVRDAAILLVGFAGAFRRSELAALDLEDIDLGEQGLILTIPARKPTRRAPADKKIGIPRGRSKATCPVAALERWIAAGTITTGAVFIALARGYVGERLSGQAIAAARQARGPASRARSAALCRSLATQRLRDQCRGRRRRPRPHHGANRASERRRRPSLYERAASRLLSNPAGKAVGL